MPRKVLFIFDRVTHYNKVMLRNLEIKLQKMDMELYLFSGEIPDAVTGRAGIKGSTIKNELKYQYTEWKIGSYIVRNQIGLKQKISALRPNVIVISSYAGSIAIWRWLWLKRCFGYKAVSWLCGYEFNPGRIKDWVLRQYIPLFDYHLAYHSNAKKYALAYGAKENRISVIHNTINEAGIKILPKFEARTFLHETHPETKGKKILLYVGAILEEKKIPSVLQALDKMNRSDLMFVIVGDGPFMPEIQRQCVRRADVLLTGKIVDGVGPYFDSADCFVLPGTGGLAINEAMAHALPIVSGYADGSAEDLVQHGKNGYRLLDNTPAEIARRISNVIDDPDTSRKFGEVSRELITSRFSFDRFIDRVCNGLGRAIAFN